MIKLFRGFSILLLDFFFYTFLYFNTTHVIWYSYWLADFFTRCRAFHLRWIAFLMIFSCSLRALLFSIVLFVSMFLFIPCHLSAYNLCFLSTCARCFSLFVCCFLLRVSHSLPSPLFLSVIAWCCHRRLGLATKTKLRSVSWIFASALSCYCCLVCSVHVSFHPRKEFQRSL